MEQRWGVRPQRARQRSCVATSGSLWHLLCQPECWGYIASSGRQAGLGGNLLLSRIIKSVGGWSKFEDALSAGDRSDPKAKQSKAGSVRTARDLPKNIWLGGRDSNPDSQIQSLESYHWTTSQQRNSMYEEKRKLSTSDPAAFTPHWNEWWRLKEERTALRETVNASRRPAANKSLVDFGRSEQNRRAWHPIRASNRSALALTPSYHILYKNADQF